MPDGGLTRFGGRWTYIPPFIHQEPSQCTMTAAQMAANIAALGRHPATQAEVRVLAARSGSAQIPENGYTTRDMLRALTGHYDLPVTHVGWSLDRWRDRLASGWACLVAVEYPKLPPRFRLDPTFTGGHRLLCTGYDPDTRETLLIDSIRPKAGFEPEPINLRNLYEAQGRFQGWQVWVREGQVLDPWIRAHRLFDEPVEIDIPSGTACTLVHRKLPGVPLEIRPDRAITLRLDRRGRRRRADGPFGRAVHRVAGGERPDLVGWWIELPAGISIDEPAPTGPIDANGEPGETYLDGYLAGIAEERARWEEWLASGPPDTGAGPAVAIAEDAGIGKGLG